MPPRRQPARVPWRRGRQPQPRPVMLTGRSARSFAREYARTAALQQAQPKTARKDAPATPAGWRFRRHIPPFTWGAWLLACFAFRTGPQPAVFVAVAAPASAVMLVLLTRHLEGFPRRAALSWAALTLAAVPLLALAPVRPWLGLTALAWGACTALWVRHYRWRPGEKPPEPDMTDYDIWARLAERRKWHGHLTSPQPIPSGTKYDIALDGIETHIGQVLAEPRALAAAWHKARTEVYAEPHPTGIESRGVLTILKAGTLETVHPWDGTGIAADGIARIGRFADGQPTRIRFLVPRDGTRHGLIAGATGSGKTETLSLLCWLAVTAAIPVVPIILDPQNGQSLPQWRDKVAYFAGVDECAAAVRGLHAGMLARSRDLAARTWDPGDGHKIRGMGFFDAAITGLPVILIIIDEAPVLLAGDGNHKLAAEMVRLLGDVAKLGRKTGVSLWPVAQVPSLSELGDQVVRSMLVGGNVVCLRTGDRVSAGMLGLDMDPSVLPKYFANGEPTGGLGYVVGPDMRQAPFRGDLPPASTRNAPPVTPLDEAFQAAMDAATSAAGQPKLTVVPAPAAETPEGPAGRTCTDAVWQVLRDHGGELSRGEIIDLTGQLVTGQWGRGAYSIRMVNNALKALADDGRVTRTGDGVYAASKEMTP